MKDEINKGIANSHTQPPADCKSAGTGEEYALITTASVYDSYGYHTVASWHYPSGYNPTPDFIGPQKCFIGPYEIPRQYLFSPYNYLYTR